MPFGRLVGPRVTLAMHGNTNKITSRGSRKGFIAPCWRVYRIPDRYQRFEDRRVNAGVGAANQARSQVAETKLSEEVLSRLE